MWQKKRMCFIPFGSVVLDPAGTDMELPGRCWAQHLTAGDTPMAVTSSTACLAAARPHRGSEVPCAQGAAAGTLAGRSAKAQAL